MKEYYKSEIERFRDKEENAPNNEVMSKIANLRKDIANERKIQSYRQSNKAQRVKNEGLDDISDEELQVENTKTENLRGKMRNSRGKWKGLQSGTSRREKDEKENQDKDDRGEGGVSHRDKDDRDLYKPPHQRDDEKNKPRDPTRERLGSPHRGRDRDVKDRDRDSNRGKPDLFRNKSGFPLLLSLSL